MRNIPVVTKNLLIINILVFVATYVFKGVNIDLNDILGLKKAFVRASNLLKENTHEDS